MRPGVALVATAMTTTAGAAGAQTPSSAPASGSSPLPLLSVPFAPEVFGLEGAGAVGRGQISVAYAPDGPRLTLYYLRGDAVRPRPTYPEPPPVPPREEGPVSTRATALWVWNTREILDDAAARAEFLEFVEARGITRVFLYLAAARGERASSGYIPFSSEEMGPLLADLYARGALTYALDGDRDYVLEENHEGVYRTVRRLVEHNRTHPVEQRFFGVRYDIEPYLVPGFQGPLREELLGGYVRLLSGVSGIGRPAGLRVAVDIPLWFDAPDEETGVVLEAVHDGERATVLDHIVALVDDFAIMDYRTRADGPNGAIAHAYEELRAAAEQGVDVFVGVETTRLLDEDLFSFFGPARRGLPSSPAARWVVVEETSGGEGRLWLVDGAEALEELARRTVDARALRHWPAGRPTRVAADAQSFYALSADSMRAVTDEIVRHLVQSPSFAGLAFHDYLGLRALLERR